MAKILITTTSFGEVDSRPLEYCRKGNDVSINPLGRKLTEAELLNLGSEADGIIAGTEVYNRKLLGEFTKLKVISRCGAGMDNIDLEVAGQRGIKVYATPDAPTLAVAELTVGLMFNLLRKINLMDAELKKCIWKKHMGSLLQGKKIGLIGLGRIGKRVAQLLMPFGVEIAYYDTKTQSRSLPLQLKPLFDLLSWADIVSVHCSASADGKKIIGRDEFMRMKKGVYFINVARGDFIDEAALYQALKEGQLSAAALDVFEKEPYTGPLSELDNVILTPHIGSYARESRINMEIQAVKNLLEGLQLVR